MSECNHDCESCGADCAERAQAGIPVEQTNELSRVGKVIAVMSGKGGVGKSVVTALMSVLLSRKGYRTAVLDADVTGPSIPRMLGVRDKAGYCEPYMLPAQSRTGIDVMSANLLLGDDTDPVIWRGPMIAGVVKQFWTDVIWNDVDFMFVDMPPGTGDVPLTVFQSLPVDGIIVVTSPQELVSMIVTKAVKMAQQMNIPILGLVENMSYAVCPDCGKKIKVFGESHIDEIAQSFGLPVLAKLPFDPLISAISDEGLMEDFGSDYLDAAAQSIEETFTGQA